MWPQLRRNAAPSSRPTASPERVQERAEWQALAVHPLLSLSLPFQPPEMDGWQTATREKLPGKLSPNRAVIAESERLERIAQGESFGK